MNPALGYYAAQALTEFLTGGVLLGLVGVMFAWSARPRFRTVAVAGALIACCGLSQGRGTWAWRSCSRDRGWLVTAAAAVLLVVVLVAFTGLGHGTLGDFAAVIAGTPAPCWNESPFSNLMLMGTWFESSTPRRRRAQLAVDRVVASVGPARGAIRRRAASARGLFSWYAAWSSRRPVRMAGRRDTGAWTIMEYSTP